MHTINLVYHCKHALFASIIYGTEVSLEIPRSNEAVLAGWSVCPVPETFRDSLRYFFSL